MITILRIFALGIFFTIIEGTFNVNQSVKFLTPLGHNYLPFKEEKGTNN